MSGNILEMEVRGRRIDPAGQATPVPGLAANAVGSVVTTSFRVFADRRASLAQGRCTVTSVKFVPSAAITVSANAPTLTLTRRTANGTAVAVVATLALTSGGPFPANAEIALTLNSANVELNVGESLTFDIAQPATTGIAVPAGAVDLDVQVTNS